MANVEYQVSIAEKLSRAEEGTSCREDPTCCSSAAVNLTQKIIAEVVGTYFVIFAGCGSVAVNKIYGSVTFPGICITWGLIVMVMVYSVGHVSGAHFNPAVTITFAIFRRFPFQHTFNSIGYKTLIGVRLIEFIDGGGIWLCDIIEFEQTKVPFYVAAQMLGSVLSSGTLRLIFDSSTPHFFGTVPVDTDIRSLVLEIIITFLLMFVISGVATDSRAIGELAGIAVGATIVLNVFVAGPISGASMNPARSIGPAFVMNHYKGLWIYIVGPLVGAISGGFVYNLIRFTDKPLSEITRSRSFLKSLSRNRI